MRGSDAVVEMLIQHGVKHVFGVPGDTSMNLHDSFADRANEIQHILCRDERNAGYMADAYARVSGKTGVVETPSGGGALYVVPAVSEAQISCIPMVCLSSEITMSSEETNALTDCNQEQLMKAVTKWNTKIRMVQKVPQLMRKAFRVAAGGKPGAVHLSIPENILGGTAEFPPEELIGSELTAHQSPFRNGPDQTDIEKTREMFLEVHQPVIIAGGGVHLSAAYEELDQFVNKFHVPVATSVNGKGSIEEYSAYAVGPIGANGGSEEGLKVVQEADLVLVLGTKLNNVTTMGKIAINKSAKVIHVDISEEILDDNIRVNLPVMSDAKLFLAKLTEAMEDKKEICAQRFEEWNTWIAQKIREKRARINEEINSKAELVTPSRIIDTLERLTDENTYFVGDAGTPTPYLASYLRLKKAGKYAVLPRAHGSLGYALPAAIGIQFAKPSSRVISLFGDGSFGMALGDLETAKRFNLPIIFIHLENNTYGWIKTIQMLYYNEKYFGVDFSQIDVVKVAEGFGLKARKIDSNSGLEEGMKWALEQKGPVLLNLIIEPPTKVVPPVLKWERDSKIPVSERKKLTY
ncbi:MAG: thiamine pyrophosphate-binding protein [Dehalobacterium sp.]